MKLFSFSEILIEFKLYKSNINNISNLYQNNIKFILNLYKVYIKFMSKFSLIYLIKYSWVINWPH